MGIAAAIFAGQKESEQSRHMDTHVTQLIRPACSIVSRGDISCYLPGMWNGVVLAEDDQGRRRCRGLAKPTLGFSTNRST